MIAPAPSWADGPLLAYDLETTGTDIANDRIVTATVVTITPGRKPVSRDWLADPGVEIPPAATEVHGISTEHARDKGVPAEQVVAEIAEHLDEVWSAGTPLCAFNASFDLSLLAAELFRHHGREFALPGPVVDPMCLDKHLDRYRKGKRTLAALCEHYQVRLEQAHDSAGDALGAARLAWRLAKSYPERIGTLAPDVLHEQQIGWYRDQQQDFAGYLERLAGRATDAAEAEQLRTRAAGIRAEADFWPLRVSVGALR